MSSKQSRFRPWEDPEDDFATASTTTPATASQAPSHTQFRTRPVASNSSDQLQSATMSSCLDSGLTSNQGAASPLGSGTSASRANDSGLARPQYVEHQGTRRRSLHTLRSKPGLPEQSTTDSNISLGSGDTLGRQSRPRTRNASVACMSCKQKRRKCVNNGRPPCESCLSNDIQCVIDGSLDQRRKAAHERRTQQTEHERNLLGDLLRVLRQPDMARVGAALDFIRSGASLEQLAEYIGSCLEDLPDDIRFLERGVHQRSNPEVLLGSMSLLPNASELKTSLENLQKGAAAPRQESSFTSRSSWDLENPEVATAVRSPQQSGRSTTFTSIQQSLNDARAQDMLEGDGTDLVQDFQSDSQLPSPQSRSPKRLRSSVSHDPAVASMDDATTTP